MKSTVVRREILVAEKDDYLVDMLVDLGLTNAEVVAKAREEAQAAGVGVVELLLANKAIRAADVTQAKADVYKRQSSASSPSATS